MPLVQPITPEVLQWITAQARAGHTPGAVLEALHARGWHGATAASAIEKATQGGLSGELPPVPVPDPDPSDSQCVLRVADREVPVLMSLRLPRVTVFGNLLSEAECEELMELARPRLQRSHTVDNWTGGSQLSDVRSSEGAFFQPGEHVALQSLEARVAGLVKWPVSHGEGLQILRYGPGAEYQPHHDYFDPSIPGTPRSLANGGQRVATVIIYLHAPEKGGATIFPDVGLRVAPVRGNAVFFSYNRPHPSTRTLHGGAPVIAGEKWIATKWLREGEFV